MSRMLKSIGKSSVGMVANLIFGAVAMKIIAVMLGPSGVGLFSLLRQAQKTATTLVSFGGETALIQGLASRNKKERGLYAFNALIFFIAGAVAVSAIFVCFAPQLAVLIIGNQEQQTVTMVRWLAVPAVIGGAVVFLKGILNGFRAIGRLAVVDVIIVAVTLALVFPAARLVAVGHGVAFVALLSAGLAAGAVYALLMVWHGRWLHLFGGESCRYDPASKRHFFRIGSVTLITGLTGAGSILAVRAVIVHHVGLSGAGIFDVAWTISTMYLMVILTSFNAYYLPSLSALSDTGGRNDLIRKMMLVSIGLSVPLIVSVVALRPFIVSLLYTNEFSPALKMLRWMLIGDYFKVTSWVLSTSMVAYADMKTFFLSEVLWSLLFFVLSFVMVLHFSEIELLGLIFSALYFAYFIFNIYYVRIRFDVVLSPSVYATLLLGLVLVLIASVVCWDDTTVDLTKTAMLITVSTAPVLWTLIRRMRGAHV